MRKFCPICNNVISNESDLAVIQVIRFRGFSIVVTIFILCRSCGLRIKEEIEKVKYSELK